MLEKKSFSRRNILKGIGLFSVAILVKPIKLLALPLQTSYRFGIRGKADTRFVLEAPQILAHRYIYLKNQNRIVIDFKSSVDFSFQSKMPAIGTIKSVRYGRFDSNYFRLVLDLKRPAVISKVLNLLPVGGAKYRMVFDITETSQSNFNKKTDAYVISKSVYQPSVISKKKPVVVEKKVVRKKKTPVIVLDPGHGGKDSGAIGKNRTYEKHIVLSVGKKLEKLLKKKGYKVYMTRRTDRYLKLQERAKIGEKRRADLFLSIHADSNPNRSAKGLSVYTLSEKASDEESRKLAKRENASDLIEISDFNGNKDLKEIFSSFALNYSVQEGIILADLIVNSAKKSKYIKTLRRTHRSAPFRVLRSTIPSALAELGFLSNASEEKLLNQNSHQNRLAKAMSDAVSKYLFS
ncbi:MAG: N-acetylmuramoyl-L-alanine amidase [Alphaproteobacteria bacterium]|nr:MAG: hypothetical protein B6I23_01825 [Rickettsiaceae bacterium 4572_127]